MATLKQALFKLIMNAVSCTTGSRIGGTAVNSVFIGVMCAYLGMIADKVSVAELLIHEFTHNILFLGALRFGHYHERGFLHNTDYFVEARDTC